MTGSLEPSAAIDRGAERLLRLTRFLAAAFAAFEQRIAAAGRLDEHGLRARLLSQEREAATAGHPYRHVVVTVPDQAADPRGLWLADYDLLARMPGLERLDIIATENVLASGFHQRLHDVLPGIEEERVGTPARPPVLLAPEPPPGGDAPRWIVCRDREEELADVARAIKRAEPSSLERTAVVFQRPLPYLYLARQVFPDAQVPYQALDALPLAAEPFAAALDLVFAFAIAEGTRASLVELLASPHWTFDAAGGRHRTPGRERPRIALLRDVKYLGGWDGSRRWPRKPRHGIRIADPRPDPPAVAARWTRAAPALRAAAAAAGALRAMIDAPTASAQVASAPGLHRRARAAAAAGRRAGTPRHLRARAAMLGGARIACAMRTRRTTTSRSPLAELSGTVRRWIEGQTFSPRTGTPGSCCWTPAPPRTRTWTSVRLVGLVESDWPERSAAQHLLSGVAARPARLAGRADRLAAARARFHDLLRSPRHARVASRSSRSRTTRSCRPRRSSRRSRPPVCRSSGSRRRRRRRGCSSTRRSREEPRRAGRR